MLPMRKSEIYKKGMKDVLEPFGKEMDDIKDRVGETSDLLDDFIDCIEWNVNDPEELVNNLKAKKNKRAKLRRFKISIIYDGKENEEFSGTLKTDLDNLKNACKILDYKRFSKDSGGLVDYKIFLGISPDIGNKESQVLYKAYGMNILQMEDSYWVDYNAKYKFEESEKERFISYYESTINKCLKKSKDAEKALKLRKKRKLKNADPLEPMVTNSALNAIEKAYNQSLEFWDDKPYLLTLVLGVPSVITSLLACVFSALALVPVCISEMVLRATVEGLKEAGFDNTFVAKAQRQILEVKLIDLIRQEQLRDML